MGRTGHLHLDQEDHDQDNDFDDDDKEGQASVATWGIEVTTAKYMKRGMRGGGKLVWLCYIAWWGVTRLFGVKIVFLNPTTFLCFNKPVRKSFK